MSGGELLRDPDEALSEALRGAEEAGADQAELSYAGSEVEFARFAGSRFTQVGSAGEHVLRIRALVGRNLGALTLASIDPEAARRAGREAVETARRSPPLEVPFSFAAPQTGSMEASAPPQNEPPPMPEALTAASAPGALAPGFERARAAGVRFAGALKSHRRRLAVRTSAGLSRRGGAGRFEASVIAELEDASGYDGATGPLSRPPDLNALAERAAERARRGRDPIDLEPGAYDVVLAPDAIAELVEWMAIASFGAAGVLDGTSLLAGRRGERVTGERVTLRDERAPEDPAFDAEGTLQRPVTLIDRGAAAEPVTDRLSALRLGGKGATSSGHAPPVWSRTGAASAMPLRVCLAPGTATEEELIASVDRGLYVTRFHYVNGLLDTRRATMTGMTRDGTFLIEGGRLGRGVKNLRFNESVLAALSRIGGLGSEAREVPTWWTDLGVISTPPVLLAGFSFTGRSR